MRFVNTATRKASPWTRPSTSEWDETSSTARRQPASTICRNSSCRSEDSGVVRTASATRSPTRYSTVPTRPQLSPAARTAESMR